MQDILKPPTYCPDALATDVGWINPRNGELLVSVRNLRQKLAQQTVVEYKREDNPDSMVNLLDRVTAHAATQPKADERTETVKALDALTAMEANAPKVDHRTDTVKALDALTDALTKSAEIVTINEGKSLALEVKDDVALDEQAPGQKRRGRPRKQAKENV